NVKRTQVHGVQKMGGRDEYGNVKNITDATSAGWVEATLQYWDNVDLGGEYGSIRSTSGIGSKNKLTSWEGIFVNGFQDNITLLRQD
ncbi:MAG TPA: hypothetical protein P5205_14775, partial [Candidatus Paceibacterota bacterium]|nr:hypothetical protein [Verrucomicrobiota bacterium]HSA11625.1 hypothetical protein [Candidatus Paceibacterota bacterium]